MALFRLYTTRKKLLALFILCLSLIFYYNYRLNLIILRPAVVYGPGALLGLSTYLYIYTTCKKIHSRERKTKWLLYSSSSYHWSSISTS